ncbi:hypothetical protein [Cystobacter ferrugineus]|uniref:Lipoprotein n=1 Tax=Cystobacter ferrugineus TaxID=83449 RepID=A0A1L9B2P0_9BACT|nr:hypothetical protein [Cystobacter ferrugineus]OJH36486.1 hypothetical protein BON30_32515 [Cystobacter ferrugineus]
MTRTRLLWTGLVAGVMALGTACSSDMSARRSEPAPTPQAEPPQSGTGGAGVKEQEKSNTGVYDDYTVPQEDRGSTGGSGYEDSVTNPDASGTSNSKEDVRDQDPSQDPGTGGSGYEEDSEMFEESQELGGSRFPGDKAVPQHL